MGDVGPGFTGTLENESGREFLVISPQEATGIIGFQLEIMARNEIPGLVSLETRMKNGRMKLYYQLTGLTGLPKFLNRRPLSPAELLEIMLEMTLILVDCDRFLLDVHSFVLKEDFLYIDETCGKLQMIYLPLYGALPREDQKTKLCNDFQDLILFFLPYFKSWHPENPLPGRIRELAQNERFDLRKTADELSGLITLLSNKEEPPPDETSKRFKEGKSDPIWFRLLSVVQTVFFRISRIAGPTRFRAQGAGRPDRSHTCPMLESIGGSLVIPVDQEVLTLGRNRRLCDYVLPVIGLSRMHARIMTQEGRFYIRDLLSKNGTYVNDVRLDSNLDYEIRDRDKIAFGEAAFCFRSPTSNTDNFGIRSFGERRGKPG